MDFNVKKFHKFNTKQHQKIQNSNKTPYKIQILHFIIHRKKIET